MGIFTGPGTRDLSAAANNDVGRVDKNQQKISDTADSPNRLARFMLGFVGLTGLGGGTVALVADKLKRDDVEVIANADGTTVGEQFVSSVSSVSNSFGDLVNSWADYGKSPDDPTSKSKPQTDFDSVSIGMAADDRLSCPEDLLAAAGTPSWIKRLTIGRFVDVADKGLPLSRFAKLTDVSVIGCEKLTGEFLGDLSKDVRRVLLENLPNLNGANLSGLCDSHSLRDLAIRGCPISIPGLTRISKMQSLESLVLVDTGRSLTEVLIALPEKGLRNVVIGGFKDLGEDEFKKIQEWVDRHNVSVTLDQADTIIEFLPGSSRRSYGLQGA